MFKWIMKGFPRDPFEWVEDSKDGLLEDAIVSIMSKLSFRLAGGDEPKETARPFLEE